MVQSGKLADILHCSEREVVEAAVEMGLTGAPCVSQEWLSCGYLTLIRNNWQLLNYEQLLQLLDWTPEKMAYTLKEEDFFFFKLGKLKPNCPNLVYSPLTDVEHAMTSKLKSALRKNIAEDEMDYVEKPFAFARKYAPKPVTGGNEKFEFNFIHSYAANCGDVLGDADRLDPVPENLLAQYASMGIRGVWMHAILYLLCPIPGAEEFSRGWEKRVENLKNIVERCERYGLKVYLYLNEPRGMPGSFYDQKPEWEGINVNGLKANCTMRAKEPLEWLEGALKNLFSEVIGLGGIFCISMSENPTHCHYTAQHELCPFCKDVPPEKIIADVIRAMERGMHAVAPDAKLLAYDWAWSRRSGDKDNIPFKKAVLDLLPENTYVLTVSEWGLKTHIGGVEQSLVDYSISQIGPSEVAEAVWEHARELGIGVAAKIQINNSWELSAVPYIPVPYLIEEHLEKLRKAGVNGLMLSWTLGGFPGGNLELLTASPEEIAMRKYHPELARKICAAWKQFSESFRQFPFHIHVLYRGPMNFGPMNVFHLNPTGCKASMIGFPHDDLESWRGVYPEEVFENQFRILTEGWAKGLTILAEAKSGVRENEKAEFEELETMANAAFCHLRSSYQQIRFVRARNHGFDRAAMAAAVKEELELTLRLYRIARRDSRIGFEASNHYFYSLNDLREKIVNCEYVLNELKNKEI